MSDRNYQRGETASACFYPRMFGSCGAVAAEHYLAAEAGADILKAGGNAVDAVVAGTLVEALVDPHMFTLGGEVPMIIRMASSAEPVVINGNTVAPAAATPAEYQRRGLDAVPDSGILAAGVPAALGALITALQQFGSLSFADTARAAAHYARTGFAVHAGLIEQERFGLRDCAERFVREWPTSAELYLNHGKPPQEGALCRNPAFADLLDLLCSAETQRRGSRNAKLEAVRETFYQGEPSRVIAEFSRQWDGLLTRNDLEIYRTTIERPVMGQLGDIRIYKCGPWNQGTAFLQALNILTTRDLRALGHNSAEYIHWVVESINLAFADREQYYGDPQAAQIPVEQLLSTEYAAVRARLIDPDRANRELRPGDPVKGRALLDVAERWGGRSWGDGTVHVNAIDRHGNMVSATPSGAWLRSSPVVGALGFPLTNRLVSFQLQPERHPNVIAPRKQPRTTISPSLATRDNKSWLVFGSMGGDYQDQWQLQFFLNRAVFGLSLQAAIEAPKFSSEHFPTSFGDSQRSPSRVRIETTLGQTVMRALAAKGHDV